MKLNVLKSKKIIISILLLIIGAVVINHAFFKPTKLNFYIASKLYKTPANTAFTDDNFYKCIVDNYNRENKTSEPYSVNLTDDQLKSITGLYCNTTSTSASDKINNVNGIEKLVGLKLLSLDNNLLTEISLNSNNELIKLSLTSNNLTKINLSQNIKLKELYLGGTNKLTELDVSHNQALEILYLSGYSRVSFHPTSTGGWRTGRGDNQLSELNLSNNNNLVTLNVEDNQLATLDISNNKLLKILEVDNNKITSLDISNNSVLTSLSAKDNQLTSLDIGKNSSIEQIAVDNNKITSLDLSNNATLERLEASANQLTNLDVSNNPALTYIYIPNNQLTSLDVSNNLELTYLSVFDNQLTSLDVSNATVLKTLYAHNNQLTSLDVSNNVALESLNASYNELTNLDIGNNPALKNLYVDNNQLTSLDVSNNVALESLNASYNELTNLDIGNNPALKNLYADNNQLTSLDVSKSILLSSKYIRIYSNPFSENLYLYNGDTIQLGRNIKLPSSIISINKWTSQDNSIATVDNNGVATAVKPGKVEIVSVAYEYSYRSASTLNIIEITSDNYIIDSINNYIIHNEPSNTIDINKINVPENVDLNLENNKLQVKHDGDVLKEFTLVGVLSNTYDLTKDYIYLGTEQLDLTKINVTNGTILKEEGKLKIKHADEVIKSFDIINISSDVYDLTKNYIYIETEELELTKINVTNGTIIEENNKLKIKRNDELLKIFDIVSISSNEYNLTKEYIYIGTKQLDITKINTTNATIVEEDNKLKVKYSNEVLKEFDILSLSSEVHDLTKDYIYIGTKQLDITKINVTNGTLIEEDCKLKVKYDDEVLEEFKIVKISSDIYDLIKDYIYIGTEQLDLTKINATNATIIKEDAQLQLKYEDTILKTWDIISISQEKYLLGKDYIFVGVEPLNIEKINIINGTLINEKEKLQVKYNDKTIYEYNILSINFNELVINKNLITVPQNMSYEDFTSNITPNGVTYKIFNKEAEVTEGTITKDMVLKIYKDGEEIYEYQITDEFLDLSLLNVDEENLLIKDLKLGTTISEFKDKILTSGSLKVLDQEGTELSDTDVVRSGAKVIIELSKDKYEYTLSVKGDVTGTGTSTVTDVGKLYQYLRKKITMDKCYIEAGNVIDTDNEIKITDVGKLYQFIKGKIDSLED